MRLFGLNAQFQYTHTRAPNQKRQLQLQTVITLCNQMKHHSFSSEWDFHFSRTIRYSVCIVVQIINYGSIGSNRK